MSSRHRLPKRAKSTDATADDSVEAATDQQTEAVELTESAAVEESNPAEPATTDTAATESAAEPSDTDPSDTESPEKGAESAAEPDVADSDSAETAAPAAAPKRKVNWERVFAFGVLPAIALLLAGAAGYLKWVDNSVRTAETVREESVQVAKDSTVAMLSYKPDTVEQQLNDARALLTGEFEESYTGLINDVVIPGAKQKQISAVASVPAAASVSADPNEAVVLVFVNQTVVVGQDPPTDSASSVRVTLEKVDGRWLISKFDPV
ncbi:MULTISPECIES: hypothetical protein [unclassified Mycobacterium]|uniref:hypothetical protein n=1 Tax=unclassified Mycobacterium TaxID=2642494 RepID=UPI00073FF225|nr:MULTISPECIES: hypothetical protein [unclassified Mycobacterium]KUH86328.1 hypothetical protein AU187_06030 [Mycobacterium sp. IS-1556]KUH86746.1 hypothetical protein AU185_19325 [Mycobacterium sp. GA-0227b]KUH92025.1 hypothetical protein AU186_06040 [Mycobacterium sp. GA-1999]